MFSFYRTKIMSFSINSLLSPGAYYVHCAFSRRKLYTVGIYKCLLSRCELIDTENISMLSQNVKLGGEWVKRTSRKLHILSSNKERSV